MSLFCRQLFGFDIQPTLILWAAQNPTSRTVAKLAAYECGGLTLGSKSIHFVSHADPCRL
ncbi:hypothetical protein N7491_005988 [Penicillium cf. griseofulvum]|nr:hypothetical protein N7491_005988 [Penicillium cf. griseofulvum]